MDFPNIHDFFDHLVNRRLCVRSDVYGALPNGWPEDDVAGAQKQLFANHPSWASDSHPNLKVLSPFQWDDLVLHEGENLGFEQWRILDEIGAGGMAKVFLARDLETDRLAAIKIRTSVEPNAASLFEREYRTLARLKHEGLPQFYSNGIWKRGSFNGSPFYVMEYLHGERLERFASGTIDIHLAIGWMCQIADILNYLHRHQILHRDLKLSNILVRDGNRISIIDLGVCKDLRVQTTASAVVGTVESMSPEQFIVGNPTAFAQDIYSLGCVFFHLLTGEKLFDGKNTEELYRQHLTSPPRSVRDFRSDCPAWLNDLVGRMLRKDPSERPRDGDALVDELRSGPPTVADAAGVGISIRGATNATDAIQDRNLDSFLRHAWIGLDRLATSVDGDLPVAVKHLEGAFEKITRLASSGIRVSESRVLAIAELLPDFETVIRSKTWPRPYQGVIIDNVGKLYSFLTALVADVLTEDFIAGALQLRLELAETRKDVEERLRSWANAIEGDNPHDSILDDVLRRSLWGPATTPLPALLNGFDSALLDRFDQAVRTRLRSLPKNDQGNAVSEFLAEQAIPFWKLRMQLPRQSEEQLSQLAGEVLSELLFVISSDAPEVFTAVPQAIKSLRLDANSSLRLRLQSHWSHVLKERLSRRLQAMASESNRSPEIRERFCEAMAYLRPAVDGKPRSSDRIRLPDDKSHFPVKSGIVLLKDRRQRMDCDLLDISCDLQGLRIRVPVHADGEADDRLESAAALPSRDFSREIPLRFAAETRPVTLDECAIELELPAGEHILFYPLESVRWNRIAFAGTPPATEIGLRIRNSEGSINALVQVVFDAIGVRLEPAERMMQ